MGFEHNNRGASGFSVCSRYSEWNDGWGFFSCQCKKVPWEGKTLAGLVLCLQDKSANDRRIQEDQIINTYWTYSRVKNEHGEFFFIVCTLAALTQWSYMLHVCWLEGHYRVSIWPIFTMWCALAQCIGCIYHFPRHPDMRVFISVFALTLSGVCLDSVSVCVCVVPEAAKGQGCLETLKSTSCTWC